MDFDRGLPSRVCRVRLMKVEDAGLVADWIHEGRQLGVFRGELRPTPESLLQYHNKIS
ncbi:MAG: hypothetical protein HY814_10255 [Candidatus Riflebacteria bacterium]|nr:hypothetical protein [Candidatus Riflebacteria bacterium]